MPESSYNEEKVESLNRSYAGDERNSFSHIANLKKKFNQTDKTSNPLNQSQVVGSSNFDLVKQDSTNIEELLQKNILNTEDNYRPTTSYNPNRISISSNKNTNSMGSVGAKLNEIKAKIRQQNSINSNKN